jgi:hypothetical protein
MTDPHGYVTFLYLGEEFYGHPIEISTEPYGRKGNWTLIKANRAVDSTIITNDGGSLITNDADELIIL